ncbi:MAG: hypothetical protein WC868_10875 [Bacteroidales bacterium]
MRKLFVYIFTLTIFSSTLIARISKPSNVTLKIYDMTGRVVKTLVNKRLSEGLHYEIWDASKKHIGTYVCELRSNLNRCAQSSLFPERN